MPTQPRYDLALWMRGDGGDAASIFHYIAGTAPTGFQDVKDLSDEIAADVPALIKAVLDNNVTYLGLTLAWRSGTSDYTWFNSTGTGPGTVTGTGLPFETAAIIRKFSIGPSRRGYGRNFIPGVPESFNNISKLLPAAKTAYMALADYLFDGIKQLGGAPTPVIVSRAGNTMYEVVEWTVNDILGHQRRRRPKF